MKNITEDYHKRITANTILKLKDNAKFWWNTKPLPGETNLHKKYKTYEDWENAWIAENINGTIKEEDGKSLLILNFIDQEIPK